MVRLPLVAFLPKLPRANVAERRYKQLAVGEPERQQHECRRGGDRVQEYQRQHGRLTLFPQRADEDAADGGQAEEEQRAVVEQAFRTGGDPANQETERGQRDPRMEERQARRRAVQPDAAHRHVTTEAHRSSQKEYRGPDHIAHLSPWKIRQSGH